ncbi:MAG TPA: hypothetical protein VMI74_18950 [Burkholderiales bacterium]|nr:hypothetical protein [Burkholderiales bacterium]
MKDPQTVGVLRWVARAGCATALAASTQPASASSPWIESHLAASYGYVLSKGEAAGRGLAAASSRSEDPKAGASRKAGSAAGPTKN